MNQYAAPQNQYSTATSRTNGLAIAGLVLSIIGIFVFSIVLGPLSMIFGGFGLSRANRGAGGRGMAIAALVIGAIDLIIGVVLIAALSAHGYRWHP
ncbi:MAG TPA: DUF4190 domain-containing protein [Acidimicrobiales bacterium]|nr:DUF4190 domain-containing protein [Acidimicrobiales bacterium]